MEAPSRTVGLVLVAALVLWATTGAIIGWIGLGLGAFAGSFAGDRLGGLRMPAVPYVALTIAVAVVFVALALFLPIADAVGYLFIGLGGFTALGMFRSRYVEECQQSVE